MGYGGDSFRDDMNVEGLGMNMRVQAFGMTVRGS